MFLTKVIWSIRFPFQNNVKEITYERLPQDNAEQGAGVVVEASTDSTFSLDPDGRAVVFEEKKKDSVSFFLVPFFIINKL